MSKILIKLKKDARREVLTTISGYYITKEKFIEVEDTDRDIESFLNYRNDLVIKDADEGVDNADEGVDNADEGVDNADEGVKDVNTNDKKDVKASSTKKKSKSTSKGNKSDVEEN